MLALTADLTPSAPTTMRALQWDKQHNEPNTNPTLSHASTASATTDSYQGGLQALGLPTADGVVTWCKCTRLCDNWGSAC